MLEIFAYAFSVMYSPGPMNLLGLHSGIQGKAKAHFGFYVGVGAAMLILFISLSFLGAQVVNKSILPYISILGCCYMVNIAWKVFRAKVDIGESKQKKNGLKFRDGLFMHLLNPKALIATLPISTIQFPAVGIAGTQIIFWSLILSIFAFGAPAGYAVAGSVLGKKIENPLYFRSFNILMSVLLVYVAASISYEHVYLAWSGS
ncbi:LysE family transporter [Vibrio sp. JC009]|uniref:LysE family translocator n=1 Tax=Vibrio sp. JC009 TaxID=2912314 RepID=UPI0023AEBBC9|nr:LysE family transporter [Vibrio sp. JC009]WED24536.1 LysE family transporter [Vibrio sp. JC009]